MTGRADKGGNLLVEVDTVSVKPSDPCPSAATGAKPGAAHRAAPLAGLFGDPDCTVHHADSMEGDPVDWAELFTRPRERPPL